MRRQGRFSLPTTDDEVVDPESDALAFFRADAEAKGMSIREYERAFGIHLMAAEHEIVEHEMTNLLGTIEQDGSEHCSACTARRAVGREGAA